MGGPISDCRWQAAARSVRRPKVAAGKSLVDDHDRRRVESIGGTENPAAPQRHAKRLEEPGGRHRDERGRYRPVRRLLAFDGKLGVEGCHRRILRRRRNRSNARDGAEPFDQPIEERIRSLAGIALSRQRQAHRQDAPRLVARFDGVDVEEAAHQQACAQEQDDGQCDLSDDERGAGARSGAPGTATAVCLQRFMRICSRGVQRRQHADENPCRERQPKAPQQHAAR